MCEHALILNNRMKKKSIHILYFLLLVWACPLLADTSKTIYIEADNLKAFNEGALSIYSGNVVITRGFTKIQAEKVELQRIKDAVTKLTAWGEPVLFNNNDPLELINASSTVMIWENDSGWLTLTGNASLTQQGNQIKGEKILYNIKSKQLNAEGGKKRVKLRIIPDVTEE